MQDRRSFRRRVLSGLAGFRALIIFVVLLAVLASVQALLLGTKTFEGGGEVLYTHYNNFVIYARSHAHLLAGQNLYTAWPSEQYDLFKYSPTFAWAFAPFAALPVAAGLILWNLINAVCLMLAWKSMPVFSAQHRAALAWILPVELMTNLQNSQCNALLAAGVIGTWVALERRQWFWAAALAAGGLFLKVYGFAAIALFIFYPARPRLAGYTIFWLALMAALPLLSVSPAEFLGHYQTWWAQMSGERQVEVGLSFAGVVKAFSGWTPPNGLLTLGAMLTFGLPVLLRYRDWTNTAFRVQVLAGVLIGLVIFNHMAESPTYIVAICGVALWFGWPLLAGKRISTGRILVLIACLALSSLSPTDIYPPVVRENFFKPYAIKALPVCVVWFLLIGEMLAGIGRSGESTQDSMPGKPDQRRAPQL